jgi:hypothetical protein
MAGIDYTIPGQFRGIQIESPTNVLAQGMQLRNLQETSEMNALKTQEYQRARGEENALRRLFATKGLDTSSPEFLNRLYEEAPGLAPGVEKNILERGKTAAEVRYKDAQAKKEAAETLSKKLTFHQQIFNPLAVTTPDEAAAHAAAFFDDPDFAPYATKMMTREQAIAKSRELFKTNKRAWLDSQLTLSGDKILEATERREKELRADQKAAYSNYVRASVLKNPDAAVLSEEEFLAQRTQATAPTTDAKRVYGEPGLYVTSGGSTFYGIPNAAAGDKIYTPAAAPTTVPTAASADGQVATVAADGTKTMPAVVLEDPNLIEPAVAALLATGDPRDKELAQMIEKRIAESRKRKTDVPTSVQELNAYLAMSPAEKVAYEKLQKIKAPNVSASATSSPAGKSLAAEVGQRANASLVKAEGAAGIMESANMVREALNTGNVIAGPLAGPRMKFAQVLELAGAGDKEKLVNTRTAVQGLATLTLESRAELKGQGQVTENEQKLLERARSGNIEDMTVAELQQVVNVSQRLANRLWSNHQTLLKRMETDPAAADSLRYYYPTGTLPSAVGQSNSQGQTDKRTQGLDKIFGGKK